MQKRVSGNICPLVSWLQIVFSCSNCLCTFGIKSSFRNGEVSVSCRAVGQKGRLFPVVVGAGLGQPQEILMDLSGKQHLKLPCVPCIVLFCCQVCSGHWVPFAAQLCETRWTRNTYMGILAGMPARFVGITLSLCSLHSWHLWLSLGGSQRLKQKPEWIELKSL